MSIRSAAPRAARRSTVPAALCARLLPREGARPARAFSAAALALGAVAVSLGAVACGGEVASSGTGTQGPQQQQAEATHALFLRSFGDPDGGKRLVDVDLVSGNVTPFSTPIPDSRVDTTPVAIYHQGKRVVADVRFTTDEAVFVLDVPDGGLGTWREIARADHLMLRVSQDLGLLGIYGFAATGSSGGSTTKIVTYQGTSIIDTPRTELPRIEALSPASRWAVIRSTKNEIELHEITADGLAGAVHTYARTEADGVVSPTVRCGLATSLILEGDYPNATWVDMSFQPLAVQGFVGRSDAVDVTDWGSPCAYQDVQTGTHHDLAKLDDRSVTPLFSYDGDGVSAVADATYVQIDPSTGGAKLVARATGQELAAYTPTAGQVATPYGVARADLRIDASSFHAESAIVWNVTRYAVEGDAMESLETDEELWTVSATGEARPAVRLWSVDQKNTTAAAIPPSYRFTDDGSRLYWVDGAHVQTIDVATGKQTTLDPDGFLDAPFH